MNEQLVIAILKAFPDGIQGILIFCLLIFTLPLAALFVILKNYIDKLAEIGDKCHAQNRENAIQQAETIRILTESFQTGLEKITRTADDTNRRNLEGIQSIQQAINRQSDIINQMSRNK